jgi:hypothetical protein
MCTTFAMIGLVFCMALVIAAAFYVRCTLDLLGHPYKALKTLKDGVQENKKLFCVVSQRSWDNQELVSALVDRVDTLERGAKRRARKK